MNKCAESKALILAVADDDRPLLQRRVARLIGAGHSPSAVMADMSKAFKSRTYTEKEKAIAGIAALGVGGCEFLKVANRGGILPSYDMAMVDMKFEEPLRPGIAPTTTFILKCLPNPPDPLLWDLLVDEISLQPQIGVVKSGHATGTCRTCTSREHRLVDQETVDELANLLEDSNSNVHLAEYATVWSVAAHHGSLYRPIPLWVVPTCNRFTYDDMAQQRRQLVTTFREVLKSARPRDAMALTATDGDSRRSRALDESFYRELARVHAPMEMPLPFYSFFVDDLGMAANFDPIHELGRLRNAISSRSNKMYSVHLSAKALLSVAHHVGITIGDHLLAPDDKQKFKTIKDFWTTLKTVADAAVPQAALPKHLKLLSWGLYLLGSLVDMFVHAIFDVAFDVQVALGLLVQAGIGFMAIFIESYGHALNKTWYKHVQRTVQSFLVTGHRLQQMEASSGIPQHMYMVLPGSQRRERLFRVVRTICTDRNCTDLELATRCDSACMIPSVYAKYPELRGTSTASAMDNLRPGNVTGNTATNNCELRTIVEKAVRNVGDLLKKHSMFVDVDSKLATWQQDERTALEPFGEPLVDFDEWNDNAPLPDSVFDVPLFADAEITCSEAFFNGGRITYNGKESHIMSVVNARLNKNVVRRAADRLLKLAGFGRTPTANETIEKVIPLRDVVWVGTPFAAVVNYKVNKRANRMRSTILLFAFSKAQRGA